MFARGGHGISRSIASSCRVYSTSPTARAVAGGSLASQPPAEKDFNQSYTSQSTVSLEQLQDQYDLFSHADVFRITFNKSPALRGVRQRNRTIIERIMKRHRPDHVESEPVRADGRGDVETVDISQGQLLAEIIHAQITACITPEDLTRVITHAAKIPQSLQVLALPKTQNHIFGQTATYHNSQRTLATLNHLIRHLEAAELPVLRSIYYMAACAAAFHRNRTALRNNLKRLISTLARNGEKLGTRRTDALLYALRTGFKDASSRDYEAIHQLFHEDSEDAGIPSLLLDNVTPANYIHYISTLGILRLTNELSHEWRRWSTEGEPGTVAYKTKRSIEIKPDFSIELRFITAFFDAQQPQQAWDILHLVASKNTLSPNTETHTSPPIPQDSQSQSQVPIRKISPQFTKSLSHAPSALWTHLFATANLIPPTLPQSIASLLKTRFLAMLQTELESLETKLGVTWTPAPTAASGGVGGRHTKLRRYHLIKTFAPQYVDSEYD